MANTPRRTIDIHKFRESINVLLATHTSSREYGQGLIEALETALRMAGQYHGFQYLEQHEVPEHEEPGIYWVEDSEGNTDPVFTNTNPTRVRYY